MLEIDHQKIRTLLQTAADRPLNAEEKSALDAHLAVCKACSDYAGNLTKLETQLRNVLHAQWDGQRPGLDFQAILHPSRGKLAWDTIFRQTRALEKVTIVVALFLGYIVIATLLGIRVPIVEQDTPTSVPTPNQLSSILATAPTPSARFTLTDMSTQACETVSYIVQANDTLEKIALEYGTSKETLMDYNSLNSNTVFTGMELAIPLCKSTPSHTANIPGNTLTITPITGTILPDQPE
jgi:LysM repeat protein